MSNSNMQDSSGFLVGTAGHIDHGKTTLIGALTGIDTDRLAEEKQRGISIDIGFAHLTLPTGETISFIDVPGHERFIKNMLAGVAGIEAVLLVVAADESVMPQTREHFAICRLLGIQRGIVALTKTDAASPEEIEITREDVTALCRESYLENAPIIQVSARTGEGLERLRAELAKLAATASHRKREQTGLARLPIDRSFSMKGFGTVITGTLWTGMLHSGESVIVHPIGREARIRGLQVHGKSVDVALAGQRTAVNLAGIEHTNIERGFVLTHPGDLQTTDRLHAYVEWLDLSRLSARRQQLVLYTGTAEIAANCKVLGPGELEHEAFVHLSLAKPTLVIPGDRYVLRRPSPAETVGGGSVIDSFPPQRLSRHKRLARLAALKQANERKRIEILVSESRNGAETSTLVRQTGLPPAEILSLVAESQTVVRIDAAQSIVSQRWLESERTKLVDWLRAFHRKNPSLAGAPVASARLNLPPAIANLVFNTPEIRLQGELIALASHRAELSSRDTDSVKQIEQTFLRAGLQPPPLSDVLKAAGADAKDGRRLLEGLIKQQKLIRVSEDLIFHADALALVRTSLSIRKGHRFSVSEFKDWTQVSRKYAIPLLEYLDRQRVTRREGEARIVL